MVLPINGKRAASPAFAGGFTSFCCPLTLGRGDQTMTYPDLIQFCMFLVALISLIYKICNDKKK